MIKSFLKRHLLKNKALLLNEAKHMRDFMDLLMKHRNTGVKLTREEIRLIRSHVKHLSLYVPAVIIFILPFGSLLLPILAEVLDRREKNRTK
ncbi:MAG: LETM1 domain-containing protein [Syntrophales bacterium LBB04]|nr:LETM1 domain-containing protein [Syntrophales bacterium LBB04]